MKRWYSLAVAAGLAMGLGTASPAGAETKLTDSILTQLQGDPTNLVLLAQLKQQIGSATNRESKCRLGVIYCLGELAAGKTGEALKVRAQLLHNFAGSPETQLLSDTALTVPCTACEQGKVNTDCPKCRTSTSCPYCHGAGKRMIQRVGKSEEIRCPQCQGSGRCAMCAGTGKVKTECPTCHGSGLALSADKIGAAYAKALGIIHAAP